MGHRSLSGGRIDVDGVWVYRSGKVLAAVIAGGAYGKSRLWPDRVAPRLSTGDNGHITLPSDVQALVLAFFLLEGDKP